MPAEKVKKSEVSIDVLKRAYYIMALERKMAQLYDQHRKITKYVHSTSLGHEAIQIAVGLHLTPEDYLYPYYRDDALLQAVGFSPYQLMLQLLAKKDDPFSGGKHYYSHPSYRGPDHPQIPHQSSATGMQAIPATGAALGIKYLEGRGLGKWKGKPIVVCSMGDGAVTEGEVAEAWQEAVLHKLPILYVVQDNNWSISAYSEEFKVMSAYEYASGFKGMKRKTVDGTDFEACYKSVSELIEYVRERKGPALLHARVPLLGHHTSGVRKEFYRDEKELEREWKLRDPFAKLERKLKQYGVSEEELKQLREEAEREVEKDFWKAVESPDPDPEYALEKVWAPSPITEEQGEREPANGQKVIMVDAALHALDEILSDYPEAIFFGQDVGRRLGGVFREAATLAEKHGDDRVFNTPIQEAFIIGSCAGLTAVGVKPIVEIQFMDYIFPSVNQLYTELAKSYYLTDGKYPVPAVIRVPAGAYGGGGPYHSGTHETVIAGLKGIKIVYPSNAADMKGLLKGAFLDPNPVVVIEHKGIYWSKVPGTEEAKTVEPDRDYVIPLGKARIHYQAKPELIEAGETMVVITYGMGVWWTYNAVKESFDGYVEIVDLRTLVPFDEQLVYERVKLHGKALVVSEEAGFLSLAESIAGRIQQNCFEYLDAPVKVLSTPMIPAIPLNEKMEKFVLPEKEKVKLSIKDLLDY